MASSYPVSKYHFIVNWGGTQTGFSEVSGLSLEFAVVEHRSGNMPEHSSIKMPGLKKYNNITLKRGVQKNDKEFLEWVNTVQMNTVERRDIVISLLDETHAPLISWRVRNAWPCKYEISPLHASSNEVLIETLELAHEGLTVMS